MQVHVAPVEQLKQQLPVIRLIPLAGFLAFDLSRKHHFGLRGGFFAKLSANYQNDGNSRTDKSVFTLVFMGGIGKDLDKDRHRFILLEIFEVPFIRIYILAGSIMP